jgi:hypothetical protein
MSILDAPKTAQGRKIRRNELNRRSLIGQFAGGRGSSQGRMARSLMSSIVSSSPQRTAPRLVG